MKRLFGVCVAVLFVIGAVASVQAADNLVLATGGTAEAATRLVRRLGGELVEMAFVVELAFLKGRGRLVGIPVYSMVVFE